MTNQVNNQSLMQTINWRDKTHFDSEDDYRTGCQNVSHCNNNSPIQDYIYMDDHDLPTHEMTPGFKPFTELETLFIKTYQRHLYFNNKSQKP